MTSIPRILRRFESKLVLYALVVLMVPLLFAAFMVRENAAAAKREVMGSGLASARGIASGVDDFLSRHLRTLLILARQPDIWSDDRPDLDALLASPIGQQDAFQWIALARTDGIVHAYSAGPQSGPVPENVSSHGWFRSLLYGQRPVFALASAAEGGASEIIIAVPVSGERRTIAQVLIAQVSLRPLLPSLLTLADRDRTAVLVADADGVPLLYSGWPPHLAKNGLAGLPPVRGALAGRSGTLDYRDEVDGSFWLSGFTPLTVTRWAVAVASPADSAPRLPGDLTPEGILVLLLVLAAALGVAVILSRRLARPIRRLSVEAANVAWGAGTTRDALPYGGDELQQISAIVARLSNGLAQNTDDLARARQELSQQTDQLREVLTRVTRTQEEERRRIAADVHDGVSQLVVGARFEIFASRRALATGRAELAESRLARSQTLLDEAVTELHRLVFDLRPKTLEELGLVEAVKRYIDFLDGDDAATLWHLQIVGEPRPLLPRVELAVFRTVQEGLNNARRHASASRIVVELRFMDGSDDLVVTVSDDGIGLGARTTGSGQGSQLGLIAMRDRAAAIGASLSISAGPAGGTTIVLRIPGRLAEPRLVTDDGPGPEHVSGQRAS